MTSMIASSRHWSYQRNLKASETIWCQDWPSWSCFTWSTFPPFARSIFPFRTTSFVCYRDPSSLSRLQHILANMFAVGKSLLFAAVALYAASNARPLEQRQNVRMPGKAVDERWADARARARSFVSQLTVEEKVRRVALLEIKIAKSET